MEPKEGTVETFSSKEDALQRIEELLEENPMRHIEVKFRTEEVTVIIYE